MPEFIMLIGLPGSGKSTYTDALIAGNPDKDYVILSTDNMIEEKAKAAGKTYSEIFPSVNVNFLTKEMKAQFRKALAEGRNIVLDRTNMSAKKRKEFLDALPENYEKIAVVFSIPDTLLKKRLAHREKTTGKSIPPMVITTMARSYVAPTKDEFDKIITINS